jgi:hypothetical protein
MLFSVFRQQDGTFEKLWNFMVRDMLTLDINHALFFTEKKFVCKPVNMIDHFS